MDNLQNCQEQAAEGLHTSSHVLTDQVQIEKPAAAGTAAGSELELKGTQSMLNDSTRAGIGKVDVAGNGCPENYAGGWAGYFDACENKDITAAFNAMVSLGMRPVPLGPDDKGKIKRPIGKEWGKTPIDERRKLLANNLKKQREKTGIGCQPFGYVVFDLDPPDKDPARIQETKDDFLDVMLAGEIIETLEVKGERGVHFWFKADDEFLKQWGDKKGVFSTPSGGHVEVFVGSEEPQIQVACAPSRGKQILHKIAPCTMPASLKQFLIDEIQAKPKQGNAERRHEPAPDGSAEEKQFLELMPRILHEIKIAPGGELHYTLRNRVMLIAGYAAGLGCERYAEKVFEVATENLDINGGCENYRQAEKTMQWAWINGIEKPLLPTADRLPVEFGGPLEGTRPASAEDIKAQIQARKWVWGNTEKNTGWLVERGLHLVEGKEGTGKTRWIMDLVRRWANGLPWPDGSPPSMAKDRKILFVAADQHWDQITTTCEEFGIPANQVLFAGPAEDPYSCISLDDRNTLDYVKRWCEELPIGMVVIDTLMGATSRPLVDPQEVAQVAGPLRALARETRIPVIMIGHLNAQGETYGRSIGRQCDHVIRMEADTKSEQTILIKSVKARWNRFELPVLYGQQGDSGWEYTTNGSDLGDPKQVKNKAAAMEQIVLYIESEGEKSWSDITAELSERGFTISTTDRALKTLVADDRLVKNERIFPSGRKCAFYDIDGYGVPPKEEPPF